jgi:formate dehydrogenase-N gamma subunit
MIEGKVSRRWAKKHHPRWYREVEAKEIIRDNQM